MQRIPPPPPRPAWRRRGPLPLWGKILIAAVIALGGLVVVGTMCFVAGCIWMISRGSQADARKIAGAGSDAVFYMENSEGDPGINAAIDRFYYKFQKKSQQMQEQQNAGPFSQFSSMNEAQLKQNAQVMQMFMPREAAITLEHAPDEPVKLVAVNPRAYGRMFKLMIVWISKSDPSVEEHSHLGHDYSCFEGDSALLFVGSTLIYSGSCGLMDEVIERIEGGSSASRASTSLEEYISDDPTYDLYGSIDNRSGALTKILTHEEEEQEETPGEEVEAQEPAEEVPPGLLEFVSERLVQQQHADLIDDVVFRLDLVSDDELEGQLVIGVTGTADRVGAIGLILDEIIEEAGRAATDEGMTLTREVTRSDEGITVDFELTGTGLLIDAFVDEMFKEPTAP